MLTRLKQNTMQPTIIIVTVSESQKGFSGLIILIVIHFYRATRMHSVVYALGLRGAVSVRLSVCHTRVLCRNNRAHHHTISTG